MANIEAPMMSDLSDTATEGLLNCRVYQMDSNINTNNLYVFKLNLCSGLGNISKEKVY